MIFNGELRAPFPWFGGKSRAAHLVWAALGDVRTYIEPFAGSLAVLLSRPNWHRQDIIKNEIANDVDQYIANFWRAAQSAPDDVVRHADWPCNEADLYSRHLWLVTTGRQQMQAGMESDPEWFDARIAGWWLWGINNWVARGWCATPGKCHRVIPQLSHPPAFSSPRNAGETWEFMRRLAARLRYVRVACGDWTRVLTSTGMKDPPVGIFLDPPYSDLANRAPGIYAADSLSVAHDVRRWAIEHGDDPDLRIVLAGYEGEHEHEMPPSWRVANWTGTRGWGRTTNNNRYRERLYLSPHCLNTNQSNLLDSLSPVDSE